MKILVRILPVTMVLFLLALVGLLLLTRPFDLRITAKEPASLPITAGAQFDHCGDGAPKEDFVHFEPADAARDGAPKITNEKALEIASRGAYVSSQLPAPATRVQYVLYTNDVQGIAKTPGDDDDADKHLLYQKVPAMLVTFCGVSVMPVSRQPVGDPSKLAPLKPVATEWNYVLDAMTGQTIIQFASTPRR